MSGRGSRWSADERGSISVGIPVFAMLVFMVGALLFRIGAAGDVRAGTQTAADAAALAAAKETGIQVIEVLNEIATANPETAEFIFPTAEELCGLLDEGAIAAAAGEFAVANGAGGVTGFDRDCLEVTIAVQSDGGVPTFGGFGAESPPGSAAATAEVEIPGLPGANVPTILELVEAGADLDFHLTA